jgi:hypothetical protein
LALKLLISQCSKAVFLVIIIVIDEASNHTLSLWLCRLGASLGRFSLLRIVRGISRCRRKRTLR